MKTLLIDNGTKHLGKLKELLYSNEFDIYSLISKYPDSSNYDLVILSGGSQFSVTSAPEIFRQEIQLIKSSKTPIIGICEGCEAIAYAFDAKLEYQERKSKGLRKVVPINNNSLFGDLEYVEAYEAHHWAITDLGKDLIGLAKSRTGFEVIKHKQKLIYGLQFHPEMLKNEAHGDEIFKRIIGRIKESKEIILKD